MLTTAVPYQINLWMGHSKGGTSSGLHHDFHDNLYVLLKGRKRFTLFAPSDAQYLYTRGELKTVHPNGVINYAGGSTREDGADAANVKAYHKDLAEHHLAHVEAELQAAETLLAARTHTHSLPPSPSVCICFFYLSI